MANITVSVPTSNITVDTTNSIVNVASTTSNVIVGETTFISNSLVRAALSVTDTGGDGSLAYNDTSGVFTYTGPSAAEVRAHLSATLPITYNSTTGDIGFNQSLDDLTLIKYQETVQNNGTKSGNVSVNIATGTVHQIALGGDITGITLQNISTGGSATIFLTQDAIGGAVLDTTTFASNWTNWKFTNEFTTLSTGASEWSALNVFFDGTDYYATLITEKGASIGNDDLANSNIIINNATTAVNETLVLGSNTTFSSDAITEGATNQYFTTAKANTALQTYIADATNSPFTFNGNVDLTRTLTFTGSTALIDATASGISNVTIDTDQVTIGDPLYTAGVLREANIVSPGPMSLRGGESINLGNQNAFLKIQSNIPDGVTPYIRSYMEFTGSGNANVYLDPIGDQTNDGGFRLMNNANTSVFSVNHLGTTSIAGTTTITGNLTVNSDSVINGNLQVQGNIDYVNSEDLLVKDQSISLNVGNVVQDAMIIVDRQGTGGGSNVELKWNESTDSWQFTNDGSTYNNMLTSALSRALISTTTPAAASGGGALAYNNTTGALTFTPAVPGIALSALSVATTAASSDGALAYDNTSGVFTFTPADTSLATKSTTDLAEGTNLYYTDARVATKIDSYVVGSENITVTSGAIATKPALGSTNSITTEASSGFAINSSDGTTVTSKFGADSTVTETANISGKGYAILNSLGTEGIVTYSGASSFEWYILSGSTTAGSTTLTITSLIRGIDGTAASITDLNVGQVINNGQNVTFPIDAYVVSINSGAGTVTMSQPAISSYAFGTLTAGAFVSGTTYQILTLGDTDWSLVGAPQVVPNNIQTGTQYIINSVGDTDFTAIGASSNNPDVVFTATGAGSGTGTVIATNFTATGAGAGTGTAAETTQTILDAGMIDTTTGLVVALYSSLRSTGSGSDSAIAQIDTLNYPFGYPATGPEANDFDIFTTGAVTDYAIGDYSAYTVGQTPLTNSRTVLNAPLGITIGENTQLTNRGENDRFQSYGMNMMWDGLTSSTRTIQPQVLFKSYTDNASQSSASLLASGAPRLFFSSANGNANDNPYDAYPRTNQELGRLSFWGSTGTQLTPSSYNVPGFISVAAADNWDTWGGQAAGNTNVYMGATSNGSNPDTYLAYKSGELILGGGNSKPVTLAPAYNGSATNPQIAYSGTQTTWANVNYANTGTNTGAKFSVTNGGSVDAGTVGDMQMSLKRVDNSSTGSASPSTVISSGFLGGSTNEIYIRFLPADAPPLQNYATTMTGITSSASGNEVALNGVQKHLAYVPTGQYQGYEWFKIFDNASYSTATTYTSLGGSAGYNQASQSGANAPYVISSGVTGREWKLNLAEQSEDLVLSSNDVAKVTFNNDVSIFSNRIRFQNLTTTEINALTGMTAGDTVYNTTEKTLCFYNGDASNGWQKVSHANL